MAVASHEQPETSALSFIQNAVKLRHAAKPGPAGPVEYQCAGSTTPGSTAWVVYHVDGIYVDIDTSECGYTQIPLYFASLGGTSQHDTSTGGSEIYKNTSTGFRMYINRKGATPTYANDRSWHVNWIASGVTPKPPVTYMCSGKTEVGATNWVQYNGNAIFVDVDTSKCGFSKEPIYVTSIAGKRNHWRTTGSSELYSKTATGFRIYIHRPGITTSDANSWKWHMNWMAAGEGTGSSVVVPCTGQTPVVTDWKYYHKDGIYVDVDTSSCGFIDTPPYVTSLIGKSNHWRSTGSSEVYKISPTGFRTYINWPGLTVAMAKDRRWRINWMAGFTTTTTTTTTVTHLR